MTVTVPAVDGRVRVTEAVPEVLVVAITLVPLAVPFESVPAEVVNRISAPLAVKPEGIEDSVTESDCNRAVPALPDWLLPPVMASVAAGLPTTIHPPSVCFDVPSVPVTV